MLRRPALLTVLAAALLVPATSEAATLTLEPGHVMRYVAGDAEENRLSMWTLDVGYGIVKDDAVPGLTGCDGPLIMAGWRHCPAGRNPVVRLGDGDDHATIADGGSDEMLWIGPADVEGGSGDDIIRTGDAADLLKGGADDDTLRPFPGANRVEGGAGDDTLESFYGDDTKVGGPGKDTFLGHYGHETILAGDGERDTISCGEGTDVVTADWIDVVAGDCETVTRVGTKPGTPTGPPKTVPRQPDAPVDPGPGPGPKPEPQPPADHTAPKLRVKLVRKGARRVLTVRADEAVTVQVAGRARRLVAGQRLRLRLRGKRRSVRVVAIDAAGNRTVKRAKLRRR